MILHHLYNYFWLKTYCLEYLRTTDLLNNRRLLTGKTNPCVCLPSQNYQITRVTVITPSTEDTLQVTLRRLYAFTANPVGESR